jgi:hypothetical protein
VTVRVQDAEGLLTANPANDDVRIGTCHGKSPSVPGLVRGRDATGRRMSVVVPPGLPSTILVSSAAFALAEDRETHWGLL